MSPAIILAIGQLISEAVLAGVEIKAVIEAARVSGGIPEEEWDRLFDEWITAEAPLIARRNQLRAERINQ
jgi:hypothetical protein